MNEEELLSVLNKYPEHLIKKIKYDLEAFNQGDKEILREISPEPSELPLKEVMTPPTMLLTKVREFSRNPESLKVQVSRTEEVDTLKMTFTPTYNPMFLSLPSIQWLKGYGNTAIGLDYFYLPESEHVGYYYAKVGNQYNMAKNKKAFFISGSAVFKNHFELEASTGSARNTCDYKRKESSSRVGLCLKRHLTTKPLIFRETELETDNYFYLGATNKLKRNKLDKKSSTSLVENLPELDSKTSFKFGYRYSGFLDSTEAHFNLNASSELHSNLNTQYSKLKLRMRHFSSLDDKFNLVLGLEAAKIEPIKGKLSAADRLSVPRFHGTQYGGIRAGEGVGDNLGGMFYSLLSVKLIADIYNDYLFGNVLKVQPMVYGQALLIDKEKKVCAGVGLNMQNQYFNVEILFNMLVRDKNPGLGNDFKITFNDL